VTELSDADARFAEIMNVGASRILAGNEDAYRLTMEIAAELLFDDLSHNSTHLGHAYGMLMGISDLLDDPHGPQSQIRCAEAAKTVAREWQLIDATSREAVDGYFTRMRNVM
jgi:hypothetical protein